MARTSSADLPRLAAAAARRILASSGPRAVTYRAVAAEASISSTSLTNRFGSIDELLDDVALRSFDEVAEVIFHADGRPLTEIGDPGATLEEALARYRRWALANPNVYQVMFAAPATGRLPSAATRSAAGRFFALFPAAAKSEVVGRRRFLEVHGEVQLELSGLAPPSPFPPSPATT